MSSRKNLANQDSKLLEALEYFVNTGDSSAKWLRLKRRWPDFLPMRVYDSPFDYVHELNQQFSGVKVFDFDDAEFLRTVKLVDRPLMSFSPQLDGTVRFTIPTLVVRDQIRRLWRDLESANELLPTMFPVRPRRALVESVLCWAEEKKETPWYGYSSPSEGIDELQTLMGSFVLKIDWTRGTLAPQYKTNFQKACYTLFIKYSAFMKFCKNPDCFSPYFIAKRLTQRYCGLDCVNAIQKERKLDWWNRVGSKRRTSANARRSPDSRSERKRDSDA
jgi:hypothetical protein